MSDMNEKRPDVHDSDPMVVDTGGDAGLTVLAQCPECGDSISVGEMAWWDQRCSCGREWYVELRAIGRDEPSRMKKKMQEHYRNRWK